MEDRINYKGSVDSTRKILKNVGFKYQIVNDGRLFFMESQYIVATCLKFLLTMQDIMVQEMATQQTVCKTRVNDHHPKNIGYGKRAQKKIGRLKSISQKMETDYFPCWIC